MSINLHLPSKTESLRPNMAVIGVGGAGCNAVNNMIESNLEGVNFVVANTDAQALEHSRAEARIQLGANITRGLGAGAMPEVGRAAAEEAIDEIAGYIEGCNMVFITAGMGGGTGTGAAPVIARLAREQGILTVGVVTKPFQFEGYHRMKLAEAGVQELQQYVDTLIVIPNQNLFRIANERTSFADAFRMADEVLHSGVRGVTDLIVMPGLINLDFADIRTVMREMGKAMMGTGEAGGDKRAVEAAEAAIQNPLLDDFSMKGAKGILINITGGYDMTLFEVDEAANRIRAEVDPAANIIFGATFNTAMEGRMRVSVVATGIEAQAMAEPQPRIAAAAQQVAESRRPYAGSFGFTGRGENKPQARPVQEPVARTQPQAEPRFAPERIQRPAAPAPVALAPVEAEYRPAANFAPRQETVYQQAAVQTAYQHEEPVSAEVESMYMEAKSVSQPQPMRLPEPSFTSPVVEQQPAQRSFLQTPQEPVRRAPPKREEEDSSERESVAGGFFAKVKEAFTPSSEPAPSRNVRAQERPRVELTKSEAKPREEAQPAARVAERPRAKPPLEDEYLDIPAFLRRQAN